MMKFIKVNTVTPSTVFSNEQHATMYIPLSSIHNITYNHTNRCTIIKLNSDTKSDIVLKGYYHTSIIEDLLSKLQVELIDLDLNKSKNEKKVNTKNDNESEDKDDNESDDAEDNNESDDEEDNNESDDDEDNNESEEGEDDTEVEDEEYEDDNEQSDEIEETDNLVNK